MSRKSALAAVEQKIEHALEVLVERFKREFAEDWEMLRLCPLQHGLETMIEKLKG